MSRNKTRNVADATEVTTVGSVAAPTAPMPRIDPHRGELVALCQRFFVSRLEVFGSASTGQSRSGKADVDFLVEFERRPPCGYADAYFGLLESLESLFGGSVDLVVDSAIKNPYFRQSVDETRTLVYAA